jgi:hypothetical protein
MTSKFFIAMLSLSLICSNAAMSQKHKVSFGDKQKVAKADGRVPGPILGGTEKGSYQLRYRYNYTFLLFFTLVKVHPMLALLDAGSMSLKWSRPILTQEDMPEGVSVPEGYAKLEVVGDQVFASFNHYDAKSKTYSTYAFYLNSEGKKIGKINRIHREKVDNWAELGEVDIVFSEDKKHFLYFYKAEGGRKEEETYTFKLFSQDLTLVNTREITFPVQDRYFLFNQIALANDKEVFISSSVYDDEENNNDGKRKKRVKSKTGSWVIHLFSFRMDEENEGEIKDLELNLKSKYVTSVRFKLTDERVVASGFYGKKPGAVNGVVSLIYDREKDQIIKDDMEELPASTLADFGKSNQKSGKLSAANMYIKDLSISKDGSYYMLGEQYYVVEVMRTSSNGFVYTDYYYYYNDLLVTKVDVNGEIAWSHRVGKKAYTRAENSLGYGCYMHHNKENDMLYITFNDHPDNFKLVQEGKFKTAVFASSNVVSVNVSPDGRMTKSLLWNNKEKKLLFHPELSSQVSPTNAFLACQRGRNSSTVTVTFAQ